MYVTVSWMCKCFYRTHTSYLYLYTQWARPQITTPGICSAEKQVCVLAVVQPSLPSPVPCAGQDGSPCVPAFPQLCHAWHPACQDSLWCFGFATSSKSLGKHLPAPETNLPFGKELSLCQRGIPPTNRRSWWSPASTQLFLAVSCNQTDNYVFAHVLGKSSLSHIRLIVFSCHLLTYNCKLHIKSLPPQQNSCNNQVPEHWASLTDL